MNKKNSKHHDKLLAIAAVVGLAAIVFVLWQWTQFPHDAFPVNETTLHTSQEKMKKPQPKMPVTDNTNK